MRIVDRKTFLALPAGTVYAKWGQAGEVPAEQDLTYGEPSVKQETTGQNDWYPADLFPAWPEDCRNSEQWADAMIHAIKTGEATAPMRFGCEARDGLYDDEQLFAVYDRVEVERLIALLQEGLATAYPS